MGKIRTRILGLEEIEDKQKKQQKEKKSQKKAREKAEKQKIRTQGLKDKEPASLKSERVEEVGKDLEKMEKAKKLIESKQEVKKEPKNKKPKKEKVRGNNYQKAKKAVDRNKKYSVEEAVKLLKKIKYTVFEESVELHLNVDKTGLKGEVSLPHSIGKTIKVKIVDDAVLTEIEKGKIEFDILITHPSFMPRLAKLAKILGPKGLMPNPKSGTISSQPEELAKKFMAGALRWKTEPKFPLIHQMVGKLSLDDKKIIENVGVFINSVGKNHITSAYIKSTMSPSVKMDLNK